MGSVSASCRPLRHSCPLWVSIETETDSTVGAESMTKDREDPHTNEGARDENKEKGKKRRWVK